MPKTKLYLIPLDPYTNEPAGACIDSDTSFVTLATISEGDLKLMPVGSEQVWQEFVESIHKQIEQNYSKKSRVNIKTLLCVCITIEGLGTNGKGAARIIKIHGFTEEVMELRHLYYCVASIQQAKDVFWDALRKFLSSKPVRLWLSSFDDILRDYKIVATQDGQLKIDG